MDLSALVKRHRVIVCAGSGGVGKTTTAASIALWGALRGRRAVALTIDPARRLASSLGVEGSDDKPKKVPPQLFRRYHLAPQGTLAAMMLDQKAAWDALIARHAGSPELHERILKNRFYQSLSSTFAGSHEYVAIEQLCVLYESGEFDLIVIDTPPTRHVLDFLEAPRRISAFLDRGVVKWFLTPYMSRGWTKLKSINRSIGFLFRKLEDATGISALAEVSDFFAAMSSMFDEFRERAATIEKILRSKDTAFLLVTGPEEQVLTEAEFLSARMAELEMPLRAVIFNRVHPEFKAERNGELASQPPGLDDCPEIEALLRSVLGRQLKRPVLRWLCRNFVGYQLLARGDALRMEQFRAALPRKIPLVSVPNFDTDLHDLGGLARMHSYLFRE